MGPAAGDAPVVFGRFEAAAPNERWVGDALHGPRVGGRKTYLFAFLDDHSRLAVGYRFGFAEDTVRLAAALQPALAARGVPGSLLCRQRVGLRGFVAAARLRQARYPADPLHPAPPAGPRQDRTLVPGSARAVPGRGHRHHRRTAGRTRADPGGRRCWSSTRCSPRGSSRSTTTGCIPRPGRPRWPGGTPAGRPPGTARPCPARTR